jgi:hypothetical protein
MSIQTHFDEEPPHIVQYDRRRAPDRRGGWRGGRRDTDWLSRPPGALEVGTLRTTPWIGWLARRLGHVNFSW